VIASITADIADAYRDGIVHAGRQPELFVLVAFLLTFGFVRMSTHLIRRNVRWWPGNLEVKGTHVHHLVWGILLLLLVGYVGVALEPASPWQEVLAILFGVGAGLTLDEFALWLNLRDVYWSHEGRRSIDAVIVAAIVAALMVLGFQVWLDLAEDIEVAAQVVVATAGVAGIGLALVNGLKGKPLMAVVALFVPLVGLVGALRLARPGSLWARIYSEGQRTRAEERFRDRSGLARVTHPHVTHEREQPYGLGDVGVDQGDRDRGQERDRDRQGTP
jgi:hypothetical protein